MLIDAQALTLWRGSTLVLQKLNLSLQYGESLALLGPSGCGKSSLLGVLSGLHKPTAGSVRVGESMSLLPQEGLLLPWKRVWENLALIASWQQPEGQVQPDKQPLPGGEPSLGGRSQSGSEPSLGRQSSSWDQAKEAALHALRSFGLEDFAFSYPHQLSGGMRQRVALLQVCMQTARPLLLLDEPFARLDALTRMELQQWYLQTLKPRVAGAVLVTHDIDEALSIADRVVVLSPRPARIVFEQSVESHDETSPAWAGLRQEIKHALGF